MSTRNQVQPRHRAILAVDIEGSTQRTDPAKGRLRQVMYDLLEEALRAAGITERHRDAPLDRGDGVLVLIHPVDQVPKTLLLTVVVPTLARLLGQQGFRLRAAVHAGEVHYDRRGWYGEALDITFRLLEAREVKRRLKQSDAPLVLVVSDDIYRTVIRHGYDGIDHRAFEPSVHVRVAGQRHRGWVHIPADLSPEPEPEPA